MQIRVATPADAGVLVEFNAAMALETEGKDLLPEVIGAGVRSLLQRETSGFYLVAQDCGRVVGRSEERRVGKEGRWRWGRDREKKRESRVRAQVDKTRQR